MLAHHYAQALFRLRGKDVFENFIEVIKRKGHYTLLPAIFGEYKKLLREGSEQNEVRIRLNNRNDLDRFGEEIASYASHLSFDMTEAHLVEDTSLIGGYIIEKRDVEVDGSYRRELLDLYQRLMRISV